MSGGGSHAGKAFREQMGQEDKPAPPPAPPGKETRAAIRKLVSGRARFTWSGGAMSGKMIDLSTAGACVLTEDMVPFKRVGTLECDIFHNGKRCAFSAPAVCVYSVLAGSKGVKVGFQFGPQSAPVSSTIAEIMA